MIDNIKTQIINRTKSKNITLARLEKNIGVPKGSVTNIINGRSTNPSIKLMKFIADGLDCSVNALTQNYLEHYDALQLDIKLLQRCFLHIIDWLKRYNCKCNIDEFLHVLQESYHFVIAGNNGVFNPKLINWIVGKTLNAIQNPQKIKKPLKERNEITFTNDS